MRLLNQFFWLIMRVLLSCRYRVRTRGSEPLRRLSGPVLVLPNHPGYVDPLLVLSHCRLADPLRPIVFSGTYRKPLLRPLMGLTQAFEVPDLSTHSRDAAQRTRAMLDAVSDALRSGDSFLLYPSGRLQRGNREVLGAARAAYDLLKRCPETQVVLVRTRGVWGSSFSCARTGELPALGKVSTSALAWLWANLFFCMPRRPVSMEFEVVASGELPLENREAFNRFLEAWYNADGEQAPLFVPYHAWFGPRAGDFSGSQNRNTSGVAEVRPDTRERVQHILEDKLRRSLEPEENQPATTLDALGLDSLDRMEVALKIEDQFGFRSSTVAGSVGDLWALAEGRLGGGVAAAERVPQVWERTSRVGGARRERSPLVLADTVPAAIVRRLLEEPSLPAVADSVSGVLTRKRALIGALLLARQYRELPGKHVAVLLPASVAADLVFLALHMAGKIPVMLNWTTGPANLAHAVRVTDVQHVVTSRKLIDRLGVEVAGAEYVYLEDGKQRIGRMQQLVALLRVTCCGRSILRGLPPVNPDDPAVFLFTSGSESVPKTVPLSHRNLLTNIADGLEVLDAHASDSLLGFLPPFHSFGLTGNLVLPLVAGLRCVYHPDPTDAQGLVRKIAAYRPSLLFSTPTFLSYILSAAQDRAEDLGSLRKVITGAEKCPDAVRARCRELAPRAEILEGYGITECSPVVAANGKLGMKAGTVGKPVRHVEVRVVDLETGLPVPVGETGMLLVSGPSIFSGYHRFEGASPFVQLEGKTWYSTGDLVAVDEEGFIVFQGRLKRFLKAGGEMISLPALEEPLTRRMPPTQSGPCVAVEGVETDSGRWIVLFSTVDITLREANRVLAEEGLRGVMRLDEVRPMEAIPVLGTGKTDYKQLRATLLATHPGAPSTTAACHEG
jgi:acyl-CoA synthetase (AMP-forming)/AMP-acid ligase II/1-acyl-sn-glycerol-3-phosphate acyltransferase/acyl carrier protein